MGQYYRCVLETAKDKEYITEGVYKFDGAKLMEFSWFGNWSVAGLLKKIYKHPMHVSVVGDYADDYESSYITQNEIQELYNKAYPGIDVRPKLFNYKYTIRINQRFLVNWTQKCFINLKEYQNRMKHGDDWIIHPLTLLTALGNGLGGGDYHAEDCKDDVGTWARDLISVEDAAPEGFSNVTEDYWFNED